MLFRRTRTRVGLRHRSPALRGVCRASQGHGDAQLVVNVAAALRRWQQRTGAEQRRRKVLREAVWFFRQRARLERPLVMGKYARSARR